MRLFRFLAVFAISNRAGRLSVRTSRPRRSRISSWSWPTTWAGAIPATAATPIVKTPHLDDMAAQRRAVRLLLRGPADVLAGPVRDHDRPHAVPHRPASPRRDAGRGDHHPQGPEDRRLRTRPTSASGTWAMNDTQPGEHGLRRGDLEAQLLRPRRDASQSATPRRTCNSKGDTSVATMNLALDFIRKRAAAKEPFFAQVCFGSPHSPHQAARRVQGALQRPARESSGLSRRGVRPRRGGRQPSRRAEEAGHRRQHDRLVHQRQRRHHARSRRTRAAAGKQSIGCADRGRHGMARAREAADPNVAAVRARGTSIRRCWRSSA